MAENILKAIITADGQQFTKTIADLEAQLKRFQEGLKSAQGVDSIARLNRAIEITKQRIEALKSFSGVSNNLKAVQGGFSGVSGAANAATISLTNVGRVFQDLPFGIVGVANNINPLVESLSRASAAAKEAGTSLGSILLKSLIGGGGLSLAFSLLTSAATFATLGLSAFTRGTQKAGEQAGDTEDDIKKFSDSLKELKSVSEIKIQSTGSVEGDIEKVNALASAITDANRSYVERKRALEELQATNKNYFGDITLETTSLEKLTQRVNEYTDALIQAAVVKGFENEISKVAPELGKLNKAFNDSQANIDKLKDSLTKLSGTKVKEPTIVSAGGTTGATVTQQVSDQTAAELKLAQSIQEETKKRDDLGVILQKQRGNYADLQDAIHGAVQESLKFKPLTTTGGGETTKGLDETQRKIIALAKDAEKVFNIPITLRFDDTDTAKQQVKKAEQVLEGIKNFTIKANVDIDLPDVKELPKEEVERFFVNVPDALQDAIQKGLLDADKVVVPGTGIENAFSKEIEAAIKAFDQNKLQIPLDIQIRAANGEKGADLLKDLQKGLQDQLINKASSFSQKLKLAVDFGQVTKQSAELAAVIDSTLTPAFQNLFAAILAGKDPLQAFFNSVIQSIEQVIQKLIAAAVEAAILQALKIGSGGFSGIFSGLLGFAEGGPTPSNKPYWVGEKGKELFFPGTSGFILSNQKSKALLSDSVNNYDETKQAVYDHKIFSSIASGIDNKVQQLTSRISSLYSENASARNEINKWISSSTVSSIDNSLRYLLNNESASNQSTHRIENKSSIQEDFVNRFISHLSSEKQSSIINAITHKSENPQTTISNIGNYLKYVLRSNNSMTEASNTNASKESFLNLFSSYANRSSSNARSNNENYSEWNNNVVTDKSGKEVNNSSGSNFKSSIEDYREALKELKTQIESTVVDKNDKIYSTDSYETQQSFFQSLKQSIESTITSLLASETIRDKTEISKQTSDLREKINAFKESQFRQYYNVSNEKTSSVEKETNNSNRSSFEKTEISKNSTIQNAEKLISLIEKITSSTNNSDSFKTETNRTNESFSLALLQVINNLKDSRVTKQSTYESHKLTALLNNISYRATGGPVNWGRPTIVGEKHAELFIPPTNGFILPYVPESIKEFRSVTERDSFNSFKSIMGFRQGGGAVTSGGRFIVGENQPELFFTTNSIQNNNQSAGIVNAQMPIIIMPDTIVKGNDIALILNRVFRSSLATTGKKPFG